MKNLLVFFALAFSLGVSAQVVDTPRVVGKFFGSQSGAGTESGTPYWQISGNFTDESGLYDSEGLKVGDVVFFADAGIGYHLPIISIQSATPPSFVIRVNRTGITNISAVPTTLGAVYEPRPNHAIMPYASGLTNPDQQTYMGYVMELIDQIGGGGNVYYPSTGIEFSTSQDSIKVDSTVARYLLGVGEDFEEPDTTGLVRTFNSWGERWSSRTDRNYYYYSLVNRADDQITKIDRIYVKPAAAGSGGYAGWTANYDPVEGTTAEFGVLNYGPASPDAAVALDADEGTVIIRGERAGFSAYSYFLAREQPSLDSNEVMLWEYDGLGNHEPRFRHLSTEVLKYSAPVSYEVAITGGNTDSKLFVTATKAGIIAAFESNKLTITIPSGTKLFNSTWHLVASDVQSAADGAGTTNWIQTQFVGIPFNGDITELVTPDVQKIAIPTAGSLSVTNAATYDFDNNPAVSVIAAATGTVTLRVGGIAAGSQGYLLKFSNF